MKKAVLNLIVIALIFLSFTNLPAGETTVVEKGNLVLDGVPEIPPRISARMNQFSNVRSAGFIGWKPDGSGILITTRFGETNQLHFVAQPMGTRRQLTFFPEPTFDAEFCPDKNKNGFLFTMDTGGSEFSQLYYLDLNSAQHTLLSDGKSRNSNGLWSNSGQQFVYTSTRRNNRDFDLYLGDITGPESGTLLVQVEGQWAAVDWSPDDSELLLQQYISANESHFYLFNIPARTLTPLFEKTDKVAYGAAAWSRDGRGIYFTSDQNAEFQRLQYLDLKTRRITVMTQDIPWDVEQLALSHHGKYLAFGVNAGGLGQVYLMDVAKKAYLPLPNLPVGVLGHLEFKPDDSALALGLSTAIGPSDVYSIALKTRKLIRWTESEIGGLNPDHFVTPTLVHYATFDSINGQPCQIPAFYYQPKKPANGPFPVLIQIHGGPEGQYQPTFSGLIQYMVTENQIAVLAPNVRGSTGYGKTYLQLDNGYLRENSVKDIGALLDWIAARPELDPNRVAVYGGSYGGYMVLAALVHYNDRLKCGVDVVGISNFVTFLENTQGYRRDLRRVEYGDERDPEMREFLLKISPLSQVHKITKPLYVVQGLNDPRVPASEAEQIVKAVRQSNSPVWYLLAKDEGHGFSKKTNRDFLNYSIMYFLEKNLVE